jgi:PAS domain S-box-containing protein
MVYRRNRLSGRLHLISWIIKTADRLVGRVKNVAKTGQNIREETSIVWKGETLWFSDYLYPVKDVNNTVSAVVTVSHNITERKRAEIALRVSEQLYKKLLEQSFDAIASMRTGKLCL